MPPDIRGMGTYFSEAGYDTAYFGKWHLNFDKKNTQHHGFATTGVLENTGHDPQIASAASQYILERCAQPFIAVVSFCDPHDICQWADVPFLAGTCLRRR